MYSKQEFLDAHRDILPYIHRTPVLTNTHLNSITGCELFFKCENFQKMGAFKMRGAVNAILNLTDDQRAQGVVTHSSGNFAQAVALGAKLVGVKSYIVMPRNAPIVKKNAVIGYGGEVIECESTIQAREATAAQVQKIQGATFLHPYNQKEVILGQGTACMELLEEIPNLQSVFAPVGGGGLISGTALAARLFGNQISTYGGEPELVNDAYRSLISGKIETNNRIDTVADGLRTTLGNITFSIIQDSVPEIFCVSEVEIIAAMKLVWERMKVIIEPSSAVPLAAIIRNKEQFIGQKIGIIVSGGNVDLTAFFEKLK